MANEEARAVQRPSTDEVDITVLITGHREGILLAQAIRSARLAIDVAVKADLRCELVTVLDRSDEDTIEIANALLGPEDRRFQVDFGHPSPARNFGIEQARGRGLALLDGDDLFGDAWLSKGFEALRRVDFASVCLHPEYTVIFGEEKVLWRHIGSDHPDFDVRHTMFENYFTALGFAPTSVFRQHPFRSGAESRGLGHEDWAWIRDTLHHGVRHLVVPETLHAVRRKRASRLVEARLHQHLVIPTPLFSGREIPVGEAR